jgi:aspartyl-tRNA(Asn)/glutamyl-tRNA(Gln) amidotransferase subunit A
MRLRGLRLGRPLNRFFDDLQPEVAACTERAIQSLKKSGVKFVRLEMPEVSGSDETFTRLVPAELLAFLGTERFTAGIDLVDPVVRARVSEALELKATEYIGLVRRHHCVVEAAQSRMKEIDGWITPTSPVLPFPVNGCDTVEAAVAWNKRSVRNTQPINYLGQCALSMPVHGERELPVGLQLICAPGEDAKLLSMALAIEGVLGSGRRPDLSEWGP